MASWERISSWNLVLPPSRPSNYHLNVIEDEIRHLDRALPTAVLGSTPELRDLLYRLGFQTIYVFEKYPHIFSKMTCLRCYDNVEHQVIGDWLATIPEYTTTFALVLSDLTSGNVSYDQQPAFYTAIARSLRPDGLFIDKHLIFEGPKRQLPPLEQKYSRLPFNLLNLNYFNCEFIFCSELLDLKSLVDTSLFYDTLAERFQNPPLRRFLTDCPKLTPRDAVWYYGRDWGQLRNHYLAAFAPLRQYDDEPSSPYYGNLKIMVNRSH